MTVQESINRGFNLLATSIVGLTGFAFLPEVFVEKDMPDKIDDALLFVFGIIAIAWYTHSTNRYLRTALPVMLVVLALLVKFGGLMIELDDPSAFGDDIGGLILLVLSTILVVRQYMKVPTLVAEQKM